MDWDLNLNEWAGWFHLEPFTLHLYSDPGLNRDREEWVAYPFSGIEAVSYMRSNVISMAFRCSALIPVQVSVKGFCVTSAPVPVTFMVTANVIIQ